MPETREALIDASVIYGAMRFHRGVHDDLTSPLRGKYRKEDDNLLFLELLHHILLYDQIVLESSNSHIDLQLSENLRNFINTVNGYCPDGNSALKAVEIGKATLQGSTKLMQERLCALISSNLVKDVIDLSTIRSVKVPSLYLGKQHYDYDALRSACEAHDLPPEVIPFALFVWRGILYDALARRWSLSNKKVAYVAAPGRLVAIKAILDEKDVARFNYPRDALRTLRASLPDLPAEGYKFTENLSLPDFSGLSSFSAVETSALSSNFSGYNPDKALREICRLRGSSSIRAVRGDWLDALFEGSATCGFGRTAEQGYLRSVPTYIRTYIHTYVREQTIVTGDKIDVQGSGNTIVNRSTVNNAFNRVKTAHSEEVAQALLDVEAAINKSGNKEAAENFDSFGDELAKQQPKESLLKTLWQRTLTALPTLAELPDVVAKISTLFA